ncbi:MAG: NUDIX domain-containing protein [Myxococcales bacterium]|nr:MAG: NUDIX domain-containing protein [Myxococcales bacterium]
MLKALAYVTRAGSLLVFRQRGRPEQGVQVPGGSVEPGEDLADAALREAREETGLTQLRVERYLGSALYQLKVDFGPPHLRHFFHLTSEGVAPERWHHVGSKPPHGPSVTFELWWEPLASVRLDWEMDAYLSGLAGTTHK